MMTGKQGIRVAMLALCTFAVSVAPAMAQDNSAPTQQQKKHGDSAQREEHRVEKLTKHLGLTPDQVTQVKAIDDAQQTQMATLRNDAAVSKKDRRDKMKTIRQDSETKIRAALTDDQKPKYDELLAKQQEHAKKHHKDASASPE